MANIKCPNCSNSMKSIKEPDLTFEKCSSCEGIFLDSGELNIFATGLSGDIEYCSIDNEELTDDHPTRSCPKCDSSSMNKVGLLAYADIIFDHCPNCSSFYLDSGEIENMNKRLKRLSPNKNPEELREFREGRLVRLDELNSAGFNIFEKVVGTVTLRMTVYFKKELNIGLRVTNEKWTDKLSKLFGLYKGQDMQVGTNNIDSKFIIQGTDGIAISNIFTNNKVQEKLLKVGSEKSILGKNGQLEIFDNCIVYTEGPYTEKMDDNYLEKSEDMIEDVIDLAEILEKHA